MPERRRGPAVCRPRRRAHDDPWITLPPSMPGHHTERTPAAARPPRPAPRAATHAAAPLAVPTPLAGLAALVAASVALIVYAWGAAPTVLPGDAAELATVALRGGVPHTPGYPTFVLVGQLAGALLLGDPAHRITLLSAIMGAAAVGLFALVLAEFGLAWSALVAGGLALAGTFTLWWSAIRTEVYTLGLALALLALWRVLVARRTLRPPDGLLAAFTIGLAMTVHLSFGALLAVAGLALAARARRAGALTPALVWGAAVALVLGLTPYLYLPWADAHFTLTNHLRTAIEPAGGQYGLTPERFDGVLERMAWLLAGPEARPRDLVRHVPTAFLNLGVAGARFALFEVGPLALLAAVLGAPRMLRRDPGAVAVLVAGGLLTPALGALAVDGALLNVFMLTSTLAVAMLAAGTWDRFAAGGHERRVLLAAAVLLTIGAPHELRVRADMGILPWASWLHMPVEGPPPVRTLVPRFRGETRARVTGLAILEAIPESSFVAARWDRVTVLKYLQSVEGRRPDLWLDPWYEPSHIVRIARWQREHRLARRPVVVVDAIPGLTERLRAPRLRRILGGVTLHIERGFVDTTLVR